MKTHLSLIVLLCATSCRQQSKQVTESCALIQQQNQFHLVVVHPSGILDTLRNIDEIAWNKQELLFHKKSKKEGWLYVFDAGDVMLKTYGPYSNKEFLLRSKELQIENRFQVVPTQKAWGMLR